MRATREAAIDLQADALDAFVIDGVEHNIPFLSALMQHPRWREGRLSTGFIAEEFKGGFRPRAPAGEELRHAGRRRDRHRPSGQRAPARRSPSRWAARSVRFAASRIAQVGTERVAAHGGRGARGADQGGPTRRQGQAPRHPRAAVGLVAGRAGVDRHGARPPGIGAGAADRSTATTSPTAASAPGPTSTPSRRPRSPR